MKVKSLMSKKPIYVDMDTKLSSIKDIFERDKFHHLLVLEKGELVGVISDRDLFKAISPKVDTIAATNADLATLNKRAHQIMTRHPVSIHEDKFIKDAIELFNNHKVSCLPVIDYDNKITGVLSWRDIFREIGKHLT